MQSATELIAEIVRHSGECVSPLRAHLIRDILVATGERYRLESNSLNLVDVLCGKLYDLADPVVVDVVDDRYNQRDLYSDACEVLNSAKFYVKEITNAAMLVLLFTDAVKLEIHTVLSRGLSGFTKLEVLGETNAVRGCKDSVKANFLGIGNGLKVVRRERGLAAGEENYDLPFWFE